MGNKGSCLERLQANGCRLKIEGFMRASYLILIGLVLLAGCVSEPSPPNPGAPSPIVQSQALFATQTALVLGTPTLSPMPVLASPTGSMTHTPEPTFQHGDSFSPSISADGRYVAFTSRSGVLIEGEMPQCTLPAGGQVHCNQVYAYDRQKGVMTLVSAAEDGAPGNGDSDHADISGDGGRVVFRSEANNLSPEAASPGGVYIRDLKTGGLERLAIDQPASEPTISDNGTLVAFSAFSEHWDVFLYDQATGTTHQISLAHDGGVSDGDNQHARVSADGRWIAFWSWAGNLVPDDTQRCQESQTNFSCGDVFVYERESGKVQRIPAGEGYGSGMGYYHISLSGDGELIQFGCSIFNRIENQLVCGDGECCGKISADREWLAYGGVAPMPTRARTFS